MLHFLYLYRPSLFIIFHPLVLETAFVAAMQQRCSACPIINVALSYIGPDKDDGVWGVEVGDLMDDVG